MSLHVASELKSKLRAFVHIFILKITLLTKREPVGIKKFSLLWFFFCVLHFFPWSTFWKSESVFILDNDYCNKRLPSSKLSQGVRVVCAVDFSRLCLHPCSISSLSSLPWFTAKQVFDKGEADEGGCFVDFSGEISNFHSRPFLEFLVFSCSITFQLMQKYLLCVVDYWLYNLVWILKWNTLWHCFQQSVLSHIIF